MDIDDKIRRGIKIAGWSMLALFLSPFVVALVVRNLPPNAERKAALELLHSPTPPVRGRDGSDALWLLHFDVPPAQQAQVAASLRRYLAEHDRLVVQKREAEAAKLPDPRAKLAAFPKLEGEPGWLCSETGLDCLAAVRKDPGGAAASLQAQAAGLDALARMASYDGTRFGLDPSFSQELPFWGTSQRLLRTRHALDFVQGRQLEAMAGTCREIAGWRRIGANTDMIITSMIGAAYTRHDLQLLSEMLAEMPPDTALPADCDAALAPTSAQELDLCPAMKLEFRSAERLFKEGMLAEASPGGQRVIKVAVGTDHAVAVIAPAYATYCGEAIHKAAAMDLKAETTHPAQAKCALFEKIGDPIGCWLAEMGNSYAGYQDRRTDLAAQLALMRTVAWAHAHGAMQMADLKGRPASLGLRRAFVLGGGGTEISIPNYDRRRDDFFALRLKAVPAD